MTARCRSQPVSELLVAYTDRELELELSRRRANKLASQSREAAELAVARAKIRKAILNAPAHEKPILHEQEVALYSPQAPPSRMTDLSGSRIGSWRVLFYAASCCGGSGSSGTPKWVIRCLRCKRRRLVNGAQLRNKPPVCGCGRRGEPAMRRAGL